MVTEDYKPIKPSKIGFAQKVLLGIAALGIAGTVAYPLIDNYRNRTDVEVKKEFSKLEVTLDKYTDGDVERRVFTQYRECSDMIVGKDRKYKYLVTVNNDWIHIRERKGNSLEIRDEEYSFQTENQTDYQDYDCDGKVDSITFKGHFKGVDRFTGKPELFQKANEDLAKFKKDIQEHLDLEKVTKEWLGEK